MEKKAPQLQNIGFEWNPRKHGFVTWEENFNRLVSTRQTFLVGCNLANVF